ncbi:MAG: hypothetical protein K6G06_05725 [Butyrivibrio sp.]|nr:hypothetical protein [Butyrivibrio sp.]
MKKKKFDPKKILEAFLYGILGMIMAVCAVIAACAFNPDLSKSVSFLFEEGVQPEIVQRQAPPAEEVADSEDSAPSEDGEVADAAEGEAAETVVEGEEAETPEGEDAAAKESVQAGAETDENTVEDTQNASKPSNVTKSEGSIVVTKSDSNSPAPVQQDESTESSYKPTVPSGKSKYVELEPEIINIEDEVKANQINNTTSVGDTGDGLTFDADYYPYYQMLNDTDRALYRQIYANTKSLNSAFKPVQQVPMNELQTVLLSVIFDHPELFWLDTTFYQEYDYNGVAIKLQLSYYQSLGDLGAARQEFEAAANNIAGQAAGLASDVEKEIFVHDLLAAKVNYKYGPLDQSAYSAIVGDNTVCAGYSKAFQYIMQKLGIPTYFVAGYAGEMHAWNMVKLGNNFYNVDVTWDDQDPTVYDFFNLSDANNYMHTRMYNSVYLPECSENGNGIF